LARSHLRLDERVNRIAGRIAASFAAFRTR
jgi:hypothetical protein